MLLLLIYGLMFCSIGLLAFFLLPGLGGRAQARLHQRSTKAQEEMSQMFVETSVKRLWVAYLVSPLLMAVVGWLIVQSVIAATVGAAVGLILPGFWVRIMRSRRRKQFNGQLVDALMMLTSSLRAGLSILQGFEVLVEEMGPPMSQEIGLVFKETKMGVSFEQALAHMKVRMPSEDLALVVTTILVARETGGNVTEVFTKLVETIRERQKVKEKIKTLTMMPRMQGFIMAILPFLFGSFALSMNPKYFEILMRDEVGNMVLAIAASCWVISLALIWLFSRPPASA